MPYFTLPLIWYLDSDERMRLASIESLIRVSVSPERDLPVYKHLVVRVVSTLHHGRAKLYRHVLLREGVGQAELEDARSRIAEPVVLDQVFRDDVRRKHSRARARSARVAEDPVGDE